MPLDVGSRLGHYAVTTLIGEGGMGEVYRARDTKIHSSDTVHPATRMAPRQLGSMSVAAMSA